MNDLTKQWKKGELLEGFYYVRCAWSDEVEIRYVHNSVDDWQEIIAEVPTYEEYQKLLSDQLAKIEGEEINAELEHRLAMVKANGKYPDRISRLKSRVVTLSDENAQLKTEYEKECRRADELEDSYWKEVEKNKKLKELLESTLSWLSDCSKLRGGRYAQLQNLKRKINEVLK